MCSCSPLCICMCHANLGKVIWMPSSLKKEDQPFCRAFHNPFTVTYDLIECSDFTHIRNKFYTTTDVHTLFRGVDFSKIREYLKELGLYDKIWNIIYQDLYINMNIKSFSICTLFYLCTNIRQFVIPF